MDKDFFKITNSIKKEVADTAVLFEPYENYTIKYFNHSLDRYPNAFFNKCYGIDISKAYATTLLNQCLILPETFKKICKLPKYERLKTVGTLATQTHKVKYIDGEVVSAILKVDENLRNCFFAISRIVGDIMDQCKIIAEDDFLFFWVDCIVLKTDKKINEICEYLKNNSYFWQMEDYTNMRINHIDNYIQVDTLKNGKHKLYTLPSSREISNFKKLKDLINKQQKFN